MEINLTKKSEIIPFWERPQYKNASIYFTGDVMSELIINGTELVAGDFIITQTGDMFKFKTSVDDIDCPFLIFVKKINVPNLYIDELIQLDNKTWQPLGTATIYQSENNEFIWEY